MVHAFTIQPLTYNTFDDETEQLEQCKEWGLLSEKAAKTKAFFYKGNGMNLPCGIVGYVDKMTAVIEFDNKQLHCIHPSYLKEMQAANYSQRGAGSADATEAEVLELEALNEDAPATVEAKVEVNEEVNGEASVVDVKKVPKEPKKEKAKKEKTPKLQLPEDKVKMIATVKEFTTVPNNFSDTEDEVVIYEAVSMTEPEMEIGEAWSSHSATLKKLELEIGDKLSFECKIVAKKLSKHPVPYKINNPAKLQKVTS
ncbi:hypothetical protein M5X11_24660 [Paenibacillus alginolyticus]|uniref:Uncharacterized protein n=1 Tax=Paenibacillus alginolyticus TaxID=59839 RepID=A0ABT4GML2_9BACL|nr:hypothetical protein [Paenibacillus alginolyticus]MCY9668079.1 hypothetical protein [Paenibacillus alginolyticus]MCY9697422.1 hypothetical protein [Paenibacillus alginolyticus]MEC0141878.1 hypothetical protein [Paenibacillus alginolyticus]